MFVDCRHIAQRALELSQREGVAHFGWSARLLPKDGFALSELDDALVPMLDRLDGDEIYEPTSELARLPGFWARWHDSDDGRYAVAAFCEDTLFIGAGIR